MPQTKHKNKIGIITSVVASCLFFAFAIFLVLNKQEIIDQITVWRFESTTEINQLVQRAGMNERGLFMFQASQPILFLPDDSDDFNIACDRIESTTAILGCYSNSRIYVYGVTDKQLDGIREVTATHETLHAVYARLSYGEKNRLNKLIEDEYVKLKDEKDFVETMAFYARTEPGQRDNELFSIIGTEVSSISPKLEEFYSKYFIDRQKVVVLNSNYSTVFQTLKDRANELSEQLTSLSSIISTDKALYENSIQQLNTDITTFNYKANNGGFSSQTQFNNERYALFGRAADLEATRANINANISKYELVLNEYNLNAAESKKLYTVIDSKLDPVPSI